MNLSWIVDKCGEVSGLRVDRAIGIQRRPPPIQQTPNSTSLRHGNLEKSKDRSGASPASAPGGGVSGKILSVSRLTRPAGKGGLTIERDRV